MSTYADTNDALQNDRLGRGFTWALILHGAAFAGIIAWTFFGHLIHGPHWGESVQQSGSIQANLVSAIPLPQKAPPIDKQVLASEDVEKVPAPQPKVSTQPPPKPDDILIKGKTPDKAQPKPTEVTAPKHPQPTPDTPKANSGASATQFPQTTTPLKNGTSTITVEDRVFGSRYAYYLRLVGQLVNQNYNPPGASGGKSVTVVFDIERDGTVANLRTEKPSGFTALDIAANRAIQSVEGFGPSPRATTSPSNTNSTPTSSSPGTRHSERRLAASCQPQSKNPESLNSPRPLEPFPPLDQPLNAPPIAVKPPAPSKSRNHQQPRTFSRLRIPGFN